MSDDSKKTELNRKSKSDQAENDPEPAPVPLLPASIAASIAAQMVKTELALRRLEPGSRDGSTESAQRKVREPAQVSQADLAPKSTHEKPADQAVDQRTQQIGDRVVSRLPPQARSRSRLQPSRQPDPSKELIAEIKSMHPEFFAKDIVVEMDRLIESMKPVQRNRYAPPELWCKAANGKRSWKELFEHPPTHKKVKNRINKVHPFPSEMSKRVS